MLMALKQVMIKGRSRETWSDEMCYLVRGVRVVQSIWEGRYIAIDYKRAVRPFNLQTREEEGIDFDVFEPLRESDLDLVAKEAKEDHKYGPPRSWMDYGCTIKEVLARDINHDIELFLNGELAQSNRAWPGPLVRFKECLGDLNIMVSSTL